MIDRTQFIAGLVLIAAVAFLSSPSLAQARSNTVAFPPLEQWKAAVISGNVGSLQALYSSNPPAQVATATGESSVTSEVAFWSGRKARRMKLDVVHAESPRPGVEQLVFQAEVHSGTGAGGRTLYVTEGQLWQKQGEQWRIAATKRSDATRLQQPLSTNKNIYEPGVDARAEIKHALQLAARSHKRVLVVFGANWCYDCHVLDLAFQRPDIAGVLRQDFEVVHVDVGEGDKNQDLMQQYDVPMKRGIPAIAVLSDQGKLLYSQKGGEFEKARALAPEDVLAFLNKWKPATQ